MSEANKHDSGGVCHTRRLDFIHGYFSERRAQSVNNPTRPTDTGTVKRASVIGIIIVGILMLAVLEGE